MIVAWVAQTPALAAALGVLLLPGLVIARGLGIRGLALWALAPAASTAVVGLLAVILGAVGIPWASWSVTLGCLLVAALAWTAGLTLHLRLPVRRLTRRFAVLLAAGFAIGITLGVLRFCFYVGDPGAISQTNDATFHLNAVRYVLESGSASPVHLTGFMGVASVYPSAWHAITSVVVMVSGASIPVAANMVALVIVGAVWPTGIALLTRAASAGVAPVALAAALSPAMLAFPLLMFQWGVVYAYALSLALVPTVAAAVLLAPRWVRVGSPDRRTARVVALVAVVLGGVGAIALAQPASVLTWAIIVLAWFTLRTSARLIAARRAGDRVLRPLLSILGAWLVFALVWVMLTRLAGGSIWPPTRGKLEALVDVAINRQLGLPAAIGVSLLLVAGLVLVLRRPAQRWLVATWGAFAALYVVVVAIGQPQLRNLLLGAWYGDPYRVAALAPLAVIPLAAVGFSGLLARLSRALHRRGARASSARPGVAALAVVAAVGVAGLVLAPVVQMPLAIERSHDHQSRYAIDAASYLSPAKRALLERLDTLVPAGSRVIANPSTGAAFGYMLSGVDVFPATWSWPRTAAWQALAEHLRDAARDPSVCAALADYGSPRYVLDFGPGEDTPGRMVMPGMTRLAGQPGFVLVAREGPSASLWRITACA